MLVRQLWSFAGDSDRADVNQGLVQAFANRNLEVGWYLLTDSSTTINWDAGSDRVTLPLGGGAGRVFKIGSQPVNMRAEAYYNVLRADLAPEWTLSATMQFLFPK